MNIRGKVLTGLGILAGYEIYQYSQVHGSVTFKINKLKVTKVNTNYIDFESNVTIYNGSSRAINVNKARIEFSYQGKHIGSVVQNVEIKLNPRSNSSGTIRGRLNNRNAVATLVALAQKGDLKLNVSYILNVTAKLLMIPVPVVIKENYNIDLSPYASQLKQLYQALKNTVDAFSVLIKTWKK